MGKLEHSKVGIISFCISLIPIVYIFIQTLLDIFMFKNKQNEKVAFILLIMVVCIAIISFILGIVSLLQKGTRKLFPIIGIIISGLILLIPVLGGIEVLHNSKDHKRIIEKSDEINISFTPEIKVVDEDFSFRKDNILIKLNMNKHDLLKVINVDELKNITEGNVIVKNKTYKYINYNFQGLSITLSNLYWDQLGLKENNFVVKSLETNNDQWKTYRGITAGGDINIVESVYGKLIKSEGQSGFSLVLASEKNILNFVSDPNNKLKIGTISMSTKQ